MVQFSYNTYAQRGYIGDLARPDEPHAIDYVPAYVPTSGRNPRPGDMVHWDATNNGAAFALNANASETVFGIVTYYPGQVGGTLAATPSGANSDQFIEYKDGELMPVIVMGTAWLLAGAALEYGNLIRQHHTNFDYTTVTKPADFGTLIAAPVTVVDVAVADGDIFQARIGYGRTF